MAADGVDGVVPTVLVLLDGAWVPALVRFQGGTEARPTSMVTLVGPDRRGDIEVVTSDRIRPIPPTR